MDVFGSVVFTGGVVLALGSFFTHVFDVLKSRAREKMNDPDKKQYVFEGFLKASSMEILLGGQPFWS